MFPKKKYHHTMIDSHKHPSLISKANEELFWAGEVRNELVI